MRATVREAVTVVIWLLWSALYSFPINGSLTFCPVTSPDDDLVFITDNPSKLVLGLTKLQCGLECALVFENCRCFNYNQTSMNCSLFDIEPTRYSVDISMSTIAYEILESPLNSVWSTVPSANCHFPFVHRGVQYCDCRQSNLFADDRVCAKSYYSCRLPSGRPAFCSAVDDQAALNASNPRDCADHWALGSRTSGVYTVYIGPEQQALEVFCDMNHTTCNGWTVIQRRMDGRTDFYRNWTEYARGFGNITRELWIGNDNLNLLTTTNGKRYKLRFDLADFLGNYSFAEYDNLVVLASNESYKLASVGRYTGTAGDSFTSHNGQGFSTYDSDHDTYPWSCAIAFRGAWWYTACHVSNLNGFYYGGPHSSFADGVEWYTWTGHHYSLRMTEMKITPVN